MVICIIPIFRTWRIWTKFVAIVNVFVLIVGAGKLGTDANDSLTRNKESNLDLDITTESPAPDSEENDSLIPDSLTGWLMWLYVVVFYVALLIQVFVEILLFTATFYEMDPKEALRRCKIWAIIIVVIAVLSMGAFIPLFGPMAIVPMSVWRGIGLLVVYGYMNKLQFPAMSTSRLT